MFEVPKKNRKRDGAKITRDRVFGANAGLRGFDPAKGGWSQTPRLAPLVAGLIDTLERKPGNAGAVYLALWARDFGASFVEVNDPADLVYEAGYVHTAKRAQRTWTERIAVLKKLGFVETHPNAHREHHYVLLLDPHWAVQRLHHARGSDFPAGWYGYFVGRCESLGIVLPPPIPTVPPAPEAPAAATPNSSEPDR